jgi:pimeloyl-ACP methyl ester carboxylesterase
MAKMETIFNSPHKYEEKYVMVDDYRTRFFEAGSGNPLLLLHGGGWTGFGAISWYATIIPLSKSFHVFAPDQLGQGYTDAPKNPNEWGHIRVRADHIIKFIEKLKVGKVNLIGLSQGGWICAYLALKRPELLNKLVIVSSGSTSGSAAGNYHQTADYKGPQPTRPRKIMRSNEFERTTQEGLRAFIQALRYSDVDEEYLTHLLPISKKWFVRSQSLGERMLTDDKVKRELMEMYFIDGKHISEHVKDIKLPTLLIWGKQDHTNIESGVELFKRIPNSQIHIFDNARHFVHVDQPEDFNGLVTWFLEKD